MMFGATNLSDVAAVSDRKGQAQATMLVLSQPPISPETASDVAIGAIRVLSSGTGGFSAPRSPVYPSYHSPKGRSKSSKFLPCG
jgi:hypothetical protein